MFFESKHTLSLFLFISLLTFQSFGIKYHLLNRSQLIDLDGNVDNINMIGDDNMTILKTKNDIKSIFSLQGLTFRKRT